MVSNGLIIFVLILLALFVNTIMLYDKKWYVVSFLILLNLYALIIFFLDNDIIAVMFVLFNTFLSSILVLKFISEIETKK